MFRPVTKKSALARNFAVLELIFHSAVRTVRKSHGDAVIGLLMNIVQSLVMVLFMVFMFTVLGMRGSAVRGDFVLYIMSGVFSFSTHSKTLQAVAKSEGSTSSMMKHAPMNTIVAISAAALSSLYLQTLAAATILFFYHTFFSPVYFDDPIGVLGVYILSWTSGIGVGMIFKALTPWQPELFGILTTIYARANMIFSGKMILANATPTYILSMYTWNPLFHAIDQTRGYMFLNYNPHYSNLTYPIVVTCILVVLGLMGENFTAKHASLSWNAKR